MEILSSMPLATYERAAKLLKQRGCLRPPETLPLLAEMFLRWQGAIGIPEPSQRAGWVPMLGDFRAIAFDLTSALSTPWTIAQTKAAGDLLIELWRNNLDAPPLHLPVWERSLNEGERPLLADWVWSHLDLHYLALTMGVLASGLVGEPPESKRDREWFQTAMEQVAFISTFAENLMGAKGDPMPIAEALAMGSGMLDGMAMHLVDGFNRGGLQGQLMARAAGWHTPSYPVSAETFFASIAPQPRRGRPRKPKP